MTIVAHAHGGRDRKTGHQNIKSPERLSGASPSLTAIDLTANGHCMRNCSLPLTSLPNLRRLLPCPTWQEITWLSSLRRFSPARAGFCLTELGLVLCLQHELQCPDTAASTNLYPFTDMCEFGFRWAHSTGFLHDTNKAPGTHLIAIALPCPDLVYIAMLAHVGCRRGTKL